eukprot:jgi/Orpsp1_1/1188712/evm.model.d7180000066661.1
MLTEEERIAIESERYRFIENGAQASYFQWLRSKGTNYTCYYQYMDSLSKQQKINMKISFVRTIIYALQSPFSFTFFYWTLLVFIIHKFNFKKPIMKLILYHFILRTLGDMFDKIGSIYDNYYSTGIHYEKEEPYYDCKNNTMHPLKWLLTRQIAVFLWYSGEIIGDWYPLLRTRAVVKNSKLIYLVYITCFIFNASKISLIILYISNNAGSLYNNEGAYDDKKSVNFYAHYYIIQFTVICTSIIYDFSVYFVLKRCIFKKNNYSFGFLKKFKYLSEFRILISSLISIVFLPIISVTIILKFYYLRKNLNALDFSFEETRKLISNVQYYLIFIDQFLLFCFKDEASNSTSYMNSRHITNNDCMSSYNISKLNSSVGKE